MKYHIEYENEQGSYFEYNFLGAHSAFEMLSEIIRNSNFKNIKAYLIK